MRAPAAPSPRAGPALRAGPGSALSCCACALPAGPQLPGRRAACLSTWRALGGGGAGLLARPAGGAVPAAWELQRARSWSACCDGASRRSERNSERRRVMKRRVPRLPACSVRAGPQRGLLGAGKETAVGWRRVGGAADTAFGSPRASAPGEKRVFAGGLGARRPRRGRRVEKRQGVSVWSARGSFRPPRRRALRVRGVPRLPSSLISQESQ